MTVYLVSLVTTSESFYLSFCFDEEVRGKERGRERVEPAYLQREQFVAGWIKTDQLRETLGLYPSYTQQSRIYGDKTDNLQDVSSAFIYTFD